MINTYFKMTIDMSGNQRVKDTRSISLLNYIVSMASHTARNRSFLRATVFMVRNGPSATVFKSVTLSQCSVTIFIKGYQKKEPLVDWLPFWIAHLHFFNVFYVLFYLCSKKQKQTSNFQTVVLCNFFPFPVTVYL